jgi:hypothetical protein
MKEIKYIILYPVPVSLIKLRFRFRFRNTGKIFVTVLMLMRIYPLFYSNKEEYKNNKYI